MSWRKVARAWEKVCGVFCNSHKLLIKQLQQHPNLHNIYEDLMKKAIDSAFNVKLQKKKI